jgi:hypothetical protein
LIKYGSVPGTGTFTEGHSLGCYDASLLSICSDGKSVSEFIHKSDLDNISDGSIDDRLELKISAALVRLKILLGA